MEYLVLCGVALVASGVTLISGFGLGTVLMPAFALFFPIHVAIAATALVHVTNNIFRALLVGRDTDWDVIKRFGVPAALASIAGAVTLVRFSNTTPVFTYHIGDYLCAITVLKLVIGPLIMLFSLFELTPGLGHLSLGKRYLFTGGLLSGFFGGFSGNQGPFRSAFLIKAGLDKRTFIATSAVSAIIVDICRLPVYAISSYGSGLTVFKGAWTPIVIGIITAIAGSIAAAQFLPQLTFRIVQIVVAVMLITIGAAITVGLV